jgi:hypothetical protein
MQKVVIGLGWITFAIEVDLMPAASFPDGLMTTEF